MLTEPTTTQSPASATTRIFVPVLVGAILMLLGVAAWRVPAAHDLGTRILLAMRHPADPSQLLGPPALQEMLRDFMGLGGEGVLVVFIAVGLGTLWLAGRRHDSIWFFGCVFGAFVIASVLKHVLARARPELIPHAAYTFTASFPSGHTVMATVTWLCLALLLAERLIGRLPRLYLIACALLIAFLVGASRVYMGVHWPGDILFAWGLGIAWVALLWEGRRRWLTTRTRAP